ncbi:MAG: NAD-dependent epimerase/dehydratase family protein [Bernardetiaceae bacterium]
MQILVIGSEGFIGSHCVDFFRGQGHQVQAADIVERGDRPHYTRLYHPHTDFAALFANHSYDWCINASGSAHVGFSFAHPDTDYTLNVLNVHKILVAIRQHNPRCRLINFSSAAVYGNPRQLPIRENAPTRPLSPYGFHKLQSEYLLKEYHTFFGLHTCSIRVFSAYGTRLRKQLFWDLYQKSKTKATVELFGTGEESRDFIAIQDLLRLVDVVGQQAEFAGEVINAGSGKETRIREAVSIFFAHLDPKIAYRFSGEVKVGDPNNWCADISLAQSLGFHPQMSIHQGLKQYVEWLHTTDDPASD